MILRRVILPLALPWVVRWARKQEADILASGEPLNAAEKARARAAGVRDVDRVRVKRVPRIPFPGGPLEKVAHWAGFVTGQTSGLCLGHGIYIRSDCWRNAHIIAHECVHTAQVERMGGFRPFLREYLIQCLRDGYAEAALEKEAMYTASEVMGGV